MPDQMQLLGDHLMLADENLKLKRQNEALKNTIESVRPGLKNLMDKDRRQSQRAMKVANAWYFPFLPPAIKALVNGSL